MMTVIADLVVFNIGSLLTPIESEGPLRGKALDSVKMYNDAFIAVKEGVFLAVDTGDYSDYVGKDTVLHDALGKLVTPGLVDSHTHLVHGGSREFEFEKKVRGVPYLDILKAGGGIHSTVKVTTEMGENDLYLQAKKSLDLMLSY